MRRGRVSRSCSGGTRRRQNLHYGYGTYLLHRDEGNPAAAVAELEKEIKVDPGAVYARLEIAYERIKEGQHAQALPYAEEAVRLAPGLFAAHNALGRALFETARSSGGSPSSRKR